MKLSFKLSIFYYLCLESQLLSWVPFACFWIHPLKAVIFMNRAIRAEENRCPIINKCFTRIIIEAFSTRTIHTAKDSLLCESVVFYYKYGTSRITNAWTFSFVWIICTKLFAEIRVNHRVFCAFLSKSYFTLRICTQAWTKLEHFQAFYILSLFQWS